MADRTPASDEDTSVDQRQHRSRRRHEPPKAVKTPAMRQLVSDFEEAAFGFYRDHESQLRSQWDWHRPNGLLLAKMFKEMREHGYSEEDIRSVIRTFFAMLSNDMIKWRSKTAPAHSIFVQHKTQVITRFEKHRRERSGTVGTGGVKFGRGEL
jgi:hypothetical protein